MRIPHFIQGTLFGPAFIGLAFFLKLTCPASAGVGCFADHLALPIFLPLVFVYKIVDDNLIMMHELWFILVYWSLVGMLVGLILDLRKSQSQY